MMETETVIELIRFGFSLIFGVTVSALFAGITPMQKKRLSIIFLCACFLLVQSGFQWLFGLDITLKMYPLLIHLPLIFILSLLYKRPLLISAVSVFSAYLCCQIPNWIEIITGALFGDRLADLGAYITTVFLTYFLLKRYAVVSIRQLMEKSVKSCVFFGVIPLFYYLFDYVTTIYTDLLYSGTKWAVQFMPSTISIFYFIFIIIYQVEMNERAKQKYEADLAREIIASGRGYYENMIRMTEQLHILRHDHKHHLLALQKLLEDGDTDEAKKYITIMNKHTKVSSLQFFCENKVLNALLSGFAERCEKEQISFSAQIELPPSETINDYEMSIITGNLLENAFTASLRTPEEKKKYIELRMHRHDGNFGFMVENSYDGVLSIKDGPNHDVNKLLSTKKDGGFGINSIESIASSHGGEYVPVWDEEKFKAFVIIKG